MNDKLREAAQQALEALEFYENDNHITYAKGPDWAESINRLVTRGYTCVNGDADLYVEHGIKAGVAANALREALAEPVQEPVVWMYQNKSTHEVSFQKHMRSFVDHGAWYEVPLYSEPLANQEKTSGSPKPAKPEALRLAELFEVAANAAPEGDEGWLKTAAELRRMHDLLGKANALCRIRAEEIERLKAQPAQEPVAWMHNEIEDNIIAHRPACIDRHPERWTALYKEPLPCPTCESLARAVMLDQASYDSRAVAEPVQEPKPVEDAAVYGVGISRDGKRIDPSSIYAAPPQRKWVGLADEEIPVLTTGLRLRTLISFQETKAFARAIEAKLKEKNT